MNRNIKTTKFNSKSTKDKKNIMLKKKNTFEF